MKIDSAWSFAAPHQLTVSCPRQLEIEPRRLAGLLLKGMKHVNCFRKLHDIDDPKFSRSVANSQFHCAGTHRRHDLPVERLETALNSIKLETSHSSRTVRKRHQRAARRAQECDRFERQHTRICISTQRGGA